MERTRLKKIINKGLQIAFPLFLGAAILIWMYHGFNFSRVWEVLDGGMNYGWMLVSLVFGVFSHIFRGWRWKLTLAPLGEHPKTSDCVYAIFVSYAANLVVPRVGEISRCGVLAKYDGTSFSNPPQREISPTRPIWSYLVWGRVPAAVSCRSTTGFLSPNRWVRWLRNG